MLGKCIALLISLTISVGAEANEDKVMLTFISEHQAHMLPIFLGAVDRLNYPKENIGIWIRTGHSQDMAIFSEWADNVKSIYADVDYQLSADLTEVWRNGEIDLIRDHIVSDLRQQALDKAKENNYKYIMFVDCEILIKDLDILTNLIEQATLIRAFAVAPIFEVAGKLYSNFWGKINEKGGYEEISNYRAIVENEVRGCFHVELIHTVFLLDLAHPVSDNVSFTDPEYYDTPHHHNLVPFFKSVSDKGGNILICNNKDYGEMALPDFWFDGGQTEKEEYLRSVLLKLALAEKRMKPSAYLKPQLSKMSTDFDMVYIINLKNRTGRRSFMEQTMYDMGVDNYKFFEAIDGKELTEENITDLGIKVMDGYEEPFHHRRYLTPGEIGCFLSHYLIWKEVAAKGYDRVLILEDDAKPIANMLPKYDSVMQELQTFGPDWDLLYLGRKYDDLTVQVYSFPIPGLSYLVKPAYSYWCVAYALSSRGIKKVLAQNPLSKMVPVDEYLPILFNQHPNTTWMEKFSPRDLIALSADPRLIFPSHYTGEKGHISDTEHTYHDEL